MDNRQAKIMPIPSIGSPEENQGESDGKNCREMAGMIQTLEFCLGYMRGTAALDDSLNYSRQTDKNILTKKD